MANVMMIVLFTTSFMESGTFGETFEVQLEKLSALYLPYQYAPIDYKMNKRASVAVAYDAEKQIIYSVGTNNIHVINMSDVTNMTVIYHAAKENVQMTDVKFCGGYIFVSMEDLVNLDQGILQVYKRFDEVHETVQLVADISVGPIPDMILPTGDCLKLVVAIEARPYRNLDPAGTVTIIKFEDLSKGTYTMKVLNFSHFDDKLADLEKEGVRFVIDNDYHAFAYDVEPKYITFNSNETTAYVCLQENNAIAIVDMITEEIISVQGLGFKDWSESKMDASDKDGDINMQPWRVYGMYQPDAIKFMAIGDNDYIVTANEGQSKDHRSFIEEERVLDVSLSSVYESNATKREILQREENLGRLKITKVNGYNSSSGAFDALYTFGGRSFSIWQADDMSLVYDSGSSISNHTAMLYPSLFNMGTDESDVARTETDTRSDNKGPEPKSLATAKFGNYTLIIVGIQYPGAILLYSIDERISTIEPKFEGMFHDIPRLDAMWKNLVAGHFVSMLGPEDIRYITATDSPNGKPLLAVSGRMSGTVTLLQLNVKLDDTPDLPTSGTDQSSSPSSLHTKEPCASVSPGLTLNQGSANVLMSETAYLATVGSLVGVLILGMITAVIYCFNLRDCKSTVAVASFRKKKHSRSSPNTTIHGHV